MLLLLKAPSALPGTDLALPSLPIFLLRGPSVLRIVLPVETGAALGRGGSYVARVNDCGDNSDESPQQNCRECPHPSPPVVCGCPTHLLQRVLPQGRLQPGSCSSSWPRWNAKSAVSGRIPGHSQLPSLAWLAQGPGRVGRTAALTMAAAPQKYQMVRGGGRAVYLPHRLPAHRGWAHLPG